jgi:hypothetical protein
MRSDAAVTVTETATSIVLVPAGTAGELGVFFQPGARVDARAYVAVLRPLAEAGHPVVIAKQPLGITFLALPAFDSARSAHPAVARWVVGGHSLAYGLQPGDGTATISDGEARRLISAASLRFVDSLRP